MVEIGVVYTKLTKNRSLPPMWIKTLCCFRILCHLNVEPRMMLSDNIFRTILFIRNFAAKIDGR